MWGDTLGIFFLFPAHMKTLAQYPGETLKAWLSPCMLIYWLSCISGINAGWKSDLGRTSKWTLKIAAQLNCGIGDAVDLNDI